MENIAFFQKSKTFSNGGIFVNSIESIKQIDTFKFKKNGHKDELKSFGHYFCNERNL